MSYAADIITAIKTVAAGVAGAPALVEARKENTLHPREANDAVIVTVERERLIGRAFGGTVIKEYQIIVGVYHQLSPPGDITSGLNANPQYVLDCKQALDVAALSGVSAVWDVTLVDNDEWEKQFFKTGMEVSYFGLLVQTSEPQNG